MSAPQGRIIPDEVSILICKKVVSDWLHLTRNIEKVLTMKEAETEAKKTEVCTNQLECITAWWKDGRSMLKQLHLYYNEDSLLAWVQRKEMPWYQSNFLQLLAHQPCLHTFHLNTPMLTFTPPVELTRIDSGQGYFDVMLQHKETTIMTWFRELPTLHELYFCHGELNEHKMFWYWEMDDPDKWHIHGRRFESDGELTIKEGVQSIENGQRNTSTSMWTVDQRNRRQCVEIILDVEAKRSKPKSISHERYRKIVLQVEGNYIEWSVLMKAHLIAVNLWEVVGPEKEELVVRGPKGVAAKA
ncbi:hypothetical protein BKA93DRAFT_746676 [Sparassis latifolia]